MSQHASSSEASAKELSKAHAAADLARAAAEQTAAEANAAATAMQADLDQCRHILQARDMQVQQLASQCQEALHRLAVRPSWTPSLPSPSARPVYRNTCHPRQNLSIQGFAFGCLLGPESCIFGKSV